jgi:hypothetical protein
MYFWAQHLLENSIDLKYCMTFGSYLRIQLKKSVESIWLSVKVEAIWDISDCIFHKNDTKLIIDLWIALH